MPSRQAESYRSSALAAGPGEGGRRADLNKHGERDSDQNILKHTAKTLLHTYTNTRGILRCRAARQTRTAAVPWPQVLEREAAVLRLAGVPITAEDVRTAQGARSGRQRLQLRFKLAGTATAALTLTFGRYKFDYPDFAVPV